MAHPQITATAFQPAGANFIQACGSSAEVTPIVFRLHLSLCHHLFSSSYTEVLPLPPPPLLGRAYDVHHSGSEMLSAHLVTAGNTWEKNTFQQGTRTWTCSRAHGNLEAEPGFESDVRHHSHRNKLYFISFNPSSTAFTRFLLYLQVTAVIIL